MAKLTLKERFSLPGTRIGNFFKGTGAVIFLVASAAAEVASATDFVNQDWVPPWLRISLVVASIVSRIGGMLTVHPEVKEAVLQIKEKSE
jgi:hypothetical protein